MLCGTEWWRSSGAEATSPRRPHRWRARSGVSRVYSWPWNCWSDLASPLWSAAGAATAGRVSTATCFKSVARDPTTQGRPCERPPRRIGSRTSGSSTWRCSRRNGPCSSRQPRNGKASKKRSGGSTATPRTIAGASTARYARTGLPNRRSAPRQQRRPPRGRGRRRLVPALLDGARPAALEGRQRRGEARIVWQWAPAGPDLRRRDDRHHDRGGARSPDRREAPSGLGAGTRPATGARGPHRA